MFLDQFLVVKDMPRKNEKSLLILLPMCASRAILVHVVCAILMYVASAHPMQFSYTQDLPPDDSSLCLGIKMVEISRVEARVLSLDCRKKMARHGNSNP